MTSPHSFSLLWTCSCAAAGNTRMRHRLPPLRPDAGRSASCADLAQASPALNVMYLGSLCCSCVYAVHLRLGWRKTVPGEGSEVIGVECGPQAAFVVAAWLDIPQLGPSAGRQHVFARSGSHADERREAGVGCECKGADATLRLLCSAIRSAPTQLTGHASGRRSTL